MARPTARVLAVLELLQAGGTHTVADLAERLAVDERTVRRYVEHLPDLDIPVGPMRKRWPWCGRCCSAGGHGRDQRLSWR